MMDGIKGFTGISVSLDLAVFVTIILTLITWKITKDKERNELREKEKDDAKKELLKIPLLSSIFKVTTVNVDRSSREDRRKSVDRLKKYLSEGDNIFIFPEGTRNKTENDPLIPFKHGAYSIAIQTQTPILPMVYYL